MGKALDLTKQLIARKSITPHDHGCQKLIAERLVNAGFEVKHLPFDEVDNIWARTGDAEPLIILAGHTDVVPPGPLDAWNTDPFEPVIKDKMLYGRGAADMKSGLAAMIVAAENFIKQYPKHNGSIGFIITSDEEGDAINGTAKVVDYLSANQIQIDYCLIGEASSDEKLADTIKIGRRGSLTAQIKIKGIQGHVAYPNKALNAVHVGMPALVQLSQTTWDNGNEAFPPTSFQIANIQAGTGANNVIPGQLSVSVNWRYSPESTPESLQKKFETIMGQHGVDYEVKWSAPSLPFYTQNKHLIGTTCVAIQEIMGYQPKCLTNGGTSDGRFIAPTGAQVVELGPINYSIHKANECINIDDLETLTQIYQRILEKLLLTKD